MNSVSGVAVTLDRPVAPPDPPKRWAGLGVVAAIVLVGGLITATAGAYFVSRPGVYWSGVRVVFLPPLSTKNPNGFTAGSESLIVTAGIIGKQVGSSTTSSPVSDAVTLVGEGIRHGYSVRLPNSGGQWATNFDQPALSVEAAGSSPAEVLSRLNGVLGAIHADLDARQTAAHVSKVNLITTAMSPTTPPMYYQRGSRARTALAVLVLGVSLTAATASLYWRRQRRTPRVS